LTKYYLVFDARCQIKMRNWPFCVTIIYMDIRQRRAVLALAAAGTLWGLTVPLSKLALGWLGPGWLAVARFLIAVAPLAVAGRRGLRGALTPRIVATGMIGFGAVILLQNAGIQRTSVSHAALIVGAVPVLVALLATGLGHTITRPAGWTGHGLALIGIALIAGGGGGGSTAAGDLLMLASAALSAAFIVLQPRVLAGRDPAAVTAVQFGAGGLVGIPFSLLSQGLPHAPTHPGPVAAFAALTVAGTVLPFWLFAFGQSRVSSTLAGTFVNLEPLVGAAVGWVAFGDHASAWQLLGGIALLTGIAVATLATGRPAAEADQVARGVDQVAPSVAPPQAAWLRLARCWPTLRLTRWRALSTVLQSQPIRRATSS
jgi:drug/metabolite transporter (DMT)-like permease